MEVHMHRPTPEAEQELPSCRKADLVKMFRLDVLPHPPQHLMARVHLTRSSRTPLRCEQRQLAARAAPLRLRDTRRSPSCRVRTGTAVTACSRRRTFLASDAAHRELIWLVQQNPTSGDINPHHLLLAFPHLIARHVRTHVPLRGCTAARACLGVPCHCAPAIWAPFWEDFWTAAGGTPL